VNGRRKKQKGKEKAKKPKKDSGGEAFCNCLIYSDLKNTI